MLLVRCADHAGDVRSVGDGRSLHVRNTPDAGERARQAVYAGAEEGDCSDRGPGERETLAPVVLFAPPGQARRCHRRTVNSGRPKDWDVNCISGVLRAIPCRPALVPVPYTPLRNWAVWRSNGMDCRPANIGPGPVAMKKLSKVAIGSS